MNNRRQVVHRVIDLKNCLGTEPEYQLLAALNNTKHDRR